MYYAVLYRIHQKLRNKISYDPNRYQEFVDWLIPPKDNKDVPPKLSGQVSVLRFPTGFYFTVILYCLLRRQAHAVRQIERQIKKQGGREGRREGGREGEGGRGREREREEEK
jgi:hypothetical protein